LVVLSKGDEGWKTALQRATFDVTQEKEGGIEKKEINFNVKRYVG